MAVHIFGAISSPSIANFAIQTAAREAEEKYGVDIAYTIRRNFYVDDCLKSVSDENVAKETITKVTQALARHGFKLTKFTSNSKKVMMSIPKDDWSKEVKSWELDYDNSTVQRALGLQWRIESDTFGYTVALEERPLTRRGLLSTICSLYDPLGFVSPVIFIAKKILRDACQTNDLSWDDDIPEELKGTWIKWMEDLNLIQQVKVDRCIKRVDFGKVVSSQLHAFSDASCVGYGICVYIRVVDENGQIHVKLLMGKSRLAPLKMTTIPKLELVAAAVSVKITQNLIRELDADIDHVVYYTDSSTVLYYIHSEKGGFPVFVANRVKQIRDFTSPKQWKYVSTSENLADIASRGITARKIVSSDLWYNGPTFLRADEITWAQQPEQFSNIGNN